MTKVFVSYKRKDSEFAHKLVDALIAQKLEVWIDWESIPPTVDWKLQIQKGVEEADAFLFLITPESVKSNECAEELAHAVRNGKRLVPLVVSDVSPDQTPKELSHLNWIFFNKRGQFDNSFQKLMEAINTDYEWVQTHRRLQVKALEWERANRENSFLLRGKDLESAEGQLVVNASREPKPTDLQRDYVLESKKAKERQRRVTTGLSIGAAVVMLILATLAVFNAREANNQKTRAEVNENIAKANEEKANKQEAIARIGEISALAISRIEQSYNEALLYSVEAYRRARETGFNLAAAQSALLTSLQSRWGLAQILPAHNDWITGLAYSPDGKTLASASWDNVTYLWDTSNPSDPIRVNTMVGDSIAFSPDNKLFATSAFDEEGAPSIIIWDLTDRANPSQFGTLPGDDVVGFTPNGGDLITLSTNEAGNNLVQVWDVSKPSQPALINTLEGLGATMSPDGKLLAINTSDENFNSFIALWNITDPGAAFQLSTRPGGLAAFSSDNSILATSNFDQQGVQMWNISDPTAPVELAALRGYTDSVTAIAFSPDNTVLASGSDDGKIYLWDISDPDNRPARPSNTLNAHSLSVYHIVFSPDGNVLTTGSYDGTIMLWNLLNKENPVRITNSAYDNGLALSANKEFLASQGYDKSSETYYVSLWNLSDPANPVELGRIDSLDPDEYIFLSNDGKFLVSSGLSPDGQTDYTYLWDISNLAGPIKTEIPDLGLYDAVFSPNNKTLVIVGYDNKMETYVTMLWDISNPSEPVKVDSLIDTPNESYDKVAFSSDSRYLTMVRTGASSSSVMIWDVSKDGGYRRLGTLDGYSITFNPASTAAALGISKEDGTEVVELWDISIWSKRSLVATLEGYGPLYSPDGASLITRKDDPEQSAYYMLLWDLTDPAKPTSQTLAGHTRDINTIGFSPDGNTMASAGLDKTIILWDISDPASPTKRATLTGHSDWINIVTFSPDGTTLASGGLDHNVILWNLSNPSDIVQIGTLKGHTASVSDIVFSQDSEKLVSFGDDRYIVWDLDPNSWVAKACDLAGSNFTEEKWSQLFPGDPYRETCESDTLASAPAAPPEQTPPVEPSSGQASAALLQCTEEQSAVSCVASTLEERDRFCVERTPYTLYAIPEGATLESASDGFSCTDEGPRNGYQLYTCYGTPMKQFTARMCNNSCAVPQSDQCAEGFGLDASQSCCTPVSPDGCINVTLEIGNCQ